MSPLTTWPITVSAGSGCGVSPNGSPVDVPQGTDKTFTFALTPGYHITDVSVDGFSQGTPN